MAIDQRLSPMDAPPVAGLSLVFQPAAVFASTSSTLTLVVSVPLLGSGPVTMTPSDNILVSFPSADAMPAPPTPLVKTLSGITTTAPGTWSIRGPRGGKFTISPLNTTTLKPGDSLQFLFRSLPIVKAVSTPSVTLQVNSSVGSESVEWPITVQDRVPGVIAWADPPAVALNAASTLRWTSIEGTIVRVSGFTTGNVTSKDFPVEGVTHTAVNPTVDNGVAGGSEHPYVVTLYAEPGDRQLGSAVTVHVYLHEPYIAQFGFLQPDNSVPKKVTVKYREDVIAKWSCVFVDAKNPILLSYGTRTVQNAPVSQFKFDPSTALAPNDDKVVVQLTAPGWNGAVSETATVHYAPVRLLYFKYTILDGDQLSGMSWLTDPPEVQSSTVGPDPVYPEASRWTVQGPGGPFTQYLGTGTEPYLEIRYFSPTGPVTAGQPFTLFWITNGATGLTLAKGGEAPVTLPGLAKGTSEQPAITGPTEFVLTATGPTGTVQSYLNVTPA